MFSVRCFVFLQRLARGPAHLAAADDVAMQMRNGFAGVWAVVDDEAVAVLIKAEL